mmetsp:Transcript_26625/g.63241  ORF Transcript_26625/g.63241 Transcript_26625/m.63241 type:complete len:325 (+) Transcript_26625:1-975(+)
MGKLVREDAVPMAREAAAMPLRALSQLSRRHVICNVLAGSASLLPSHLSARQPVHTASSPGAARRSLAASSQQQPSSLTKISNMARDAITTARNTRFPPGYWEMTWPGVQIQAVRYGLAGGALIGTAKAVHFSYELSTFLVTGSEVPAAVAYMGGFGTAAALSAGALLAHRAVSVDASELRGIAFNTVQRNFLLERVLGGGLRVGDAMASVITAAGVTLREKRRLTHYLAPLAWHPASAHLLFQVAGEDRTAVVTVEVTKLGGKYQIKSLRAEVQDEALPPEERFFQFVGEPSEAETAIDFLDFSKSPPVNKPPQYFLQLGNLW